VWLPLAGLLLIGQGSQAADFVRFEVCAYSEDRQSFTRPGQEFNLIRYFWVNPERVSAIGFEFMQGEGQALQCSRLFFGGGNQILVVGSVDEVRRKLSSRRAGE
jgi:hypothetical protein